MKRRLLFYSSVKEISDFMTSSFYKIDIQILEDMGFDVEVTNKLSKYFQFWRYDTAFIYFFRIGFFAGIVARVLLKSVYFTGGIDNLSSSVTSRTGMAIQKILFAMCYIVSTKCLIVSNSDLNNISRFWKPCSKLIVVPHAIDSKYYYSLNPKERIVTTICWMGSISNVKRKGVDQLILGFAKFLKSYPDFKLVIIGRLGPGSAYLSDIVRNQNISTSVVFTNTVSDVEKKYFLARSRYYAQISKFEGFGLAVIEAMASSCIIIHTGNGGLIETVGNDGVLVTNSNDPEAISEAFIKCELELEKYSFLAGVGCRKIRNTFDINTRFSRFQKIITSH